MKLVAFKHHDKELTFFINPEHVCALTWVDEMTCILTSSQVTYFTKEDIGSVAYRLLSGADLDFAEVDE